jgi:acetate kinase
MRILIVNAGSSSVKLSLVEQPGDQTLSDLELEHDADSDLGASLTSIGASSADAVGHRVVHGGARHDPTIVNDGVLTEIEALDELAPLHNRAAAGAIRDVRHLLPDVPHVACFDTAFHASLPEAAWRYALPDDLVERFKIRRYGFHGLAVAWAVERTSSLLGRSPDELRLVVAHLGSGASVTAVAGGRSVATSMGMTPYEGLVMGTRAGSVDPGILLHLMRHGIDADALADALVRRGGLAALSGFGGGMRAVERAAADGDQRSRLAVDVFSARAAAEIASAATSLDRLDALAFSGGIGERSALVRSRISERLGVLGVPPLAAVDEETADRIIATGGPGPAVVVIHAREDLVMSRLVHVLVTSGPG